MMRTRMAVVGALSAAALLVAGCGGDEEQADQNDKQQSDTEKKQPADGNETKEVEKGGDQEESGDDGGNAAGEATPPGTTLKFGEQAILPVEKDGKEHLVGLTVTGIEEGDKKAFTQAFGDGAEGMTPYYIKFTAENLDGADLSFTYAPDLTGTGAGGKSNPNVVSGELDDCENPAAPEEFAEKGATFEGCVLEAAGSDAIVEAKHGEDGDYYNDPVVWKP